VGICTCSTVARAAGAPDATGEAQFRLGARDEVDGDYARALADYRASLNASPSGRLARNARNRILWIEAHSEGGFAPLAALARLRRTPSLADETAASAQLAAEAESFPPGLVRSEIRLRLAQAWLRRPMRRDDALGELRRIVSDPSAGPADVVLAERGLVEALLGDGELDAAEAEVLAHPFDPAASAHVGRRLRRRRLWRTVEAGLIVVTAFAVVALARRRRGGGASLPPASECADSGA